MARTFHEGEGASQQEERGQGYRFTGRDNPEVGGDRCGAATWPSGFGLFAKAIRSCASWTGEALRFGGDQLNEVVRQQSECLSELGHLLRGTTELFGSTVGTIGEQARRAAAAAREASSERGGGRRRAEHAPKNYRRSDDRILDEVSERIARSGIDADEVEVKVSEGVVKLSGRIPDREQKRALEDLAEEVFGVVGVDSDVRVARGADIGEGWRSNADRGRAETTQMPRA